MRVSSMALLLDHGTDLHAGAAEPRADRAVRNAERLADLRTDRLPGQPDTKKDGLRILATRFRGRGMATNRYDVWMPSLGPSEQILRDVLSDKISWATFVREYRREMLMDGPIDARSRTIKNHGQKFTLRLLKRLAEKGRVTVMCHCAEDEPHCHRHELKKLITRA